MKMRLAGGMLASLGSILALAACQAENPNSQPENAETRSMEERLNYQPPENPRMEGGARLVKPTDAELAAFLAKGEFHEPAPSPVTGGTGSQTATLPAGKSAAPGYSCTMNFNGVNSMSLLPNQAWDTMAYFPWYIQYCDYNSYMYTVPLKVGAQKPLETHHHLGFENSYFCNIDVVTGKQAPAPKIGVYEKLPTRKAPNCADWVFSKCTFSTVDAKNFARFLMPHGAGFWMQFYPKRDNVRKKFDLTSIRILPNTFATDGCGPNDGKIQVWVKKAATQQWWYWDGLLPGYNWSPYPQDGADLDELQIATATGVTGPFKVDDIKVNIHF